jgi:hypothetical protein
MADEQPAANAITIQKWARGHLVRLKVQEIWNSLEDSAKAIESGGGPSSDGAEEYSEDPDEASQDNRRNRSNSILNSPQKRWYVSTFSEELGGVTRARNESNSTSAEENSGTPLNYGNLDYDVYCLIQNTNYFRSRSHLSNQNLRRMLIATYLMEYEDEIVVQNVLQMLTVVCGKRISFDEIILPTKMHDLLVEFNNKSTNNARFVLDVLKVDLYLASCAKELEGYRYGRALATAVPGNLHSKVARSACKLIQQYYDSAFLKNRQALDKREKESRPGVHESARTWLSLVAVAASIGVFVFKK